MNHQTTYRSPIKLLSLTPAEITAISPDVIEMAKNRLCDNDTTKESLASNLQHITPATWAFHRTVYEHEGLLHFLEDGVFHAEKMSKAAYLRYKPSFVQFISLPFAHAFNLAAKDALQPKDDYQLLKDLLDYCSFILPQHETIAFEAIREHLQQQEQTLSLLHWEQFVRDESLLDFAFSSNWINCMNNLPATCDAQCSALVAALLQVLKRFRLDASPDYLKALCAKLRTVKMEPALQQELQAYVSSFYLQKPVEVAVQKTKVSRLPYYIIGGALLVLAVLFLLMQLGQGKKRPPQAEDKYMEAVESTSAKDQLNSSVNEKNLKAFFFLASRQENKGKRSPLQTGATPLPGVTKLPANDGNSSMTVRNETAADAVLFYFGSDNPLVNKKSQLVAVYIRSGDEFRFRFQPDFGRFNFVFGKDWVQLKEPAFFPFATGEGESIFSKDREKLLANAWLIPSFFRQVRPSQPLLIHDLILTNIEQPTVSSANARVYTLLNEKDRNKRYSDEGSVEISLKETNGTIGVKARSSLYVYQSPPTFDPKELQ